MIDLFSKENSEYAEEKAVEKEMAADLVKQAFDEKAALTHAQNVLFDAEKYTTNPSIEFKDIRNEEYRTYVFPPTFAGGPNNEIRIDQPEAVATKAPSRTFTGGGSHRVVDKNGMSHYIPAGWIGIYWEKDNDPGKVAYEW